MSTLVDSATNHQKRAAIALIFVATLIVAAIAIPNLNRSRLASTASEVTQETELSGGRYYDFAAQTKPAARTTSDVVLGPPTAVTAASSEQRKIRTSSLEMVVQHPADAIDRISSLAEHAGGYVVSSEGGGQDSAVGSLTIRVPAERFEEVRAEIRKLGLRVESERIEAQDVTRQYVDQEASIRNLHAEESQYLAILKQASTVKDMLAVSEKLSGVRGQIEQQQAEFNALSKQTETVAIAISLRTQTETQIFGLNWRPLYQVKVALRDGLESIGNYAAVMVSILFYLPAALLWVATILGSAIVVWKSARWVGRKWFGWGAVVVAGGQS